MVVPPDRTGVCKPVVFTMESNYVIFLFSTPLVSFRVARIWSFVVVTVSRERCRHLQNRIFIFYCILQGGLFWLLHFVETICIFLFSIFRPSKLFLFFVVFVEAVCDFLVCAFNPSRLFFVFLLRFSTPLVYFSFFIYV